MVFSRAQGACLLLATLGASPALAVNLKPNPPLRAVVGPVIIAHRAGGVAGEENSLRAAKQALKAGADWLEVDVRMARDGSLWLLHDETLDRVTRATGRISARSAPELAGVKLRSGEALPTLEAMLSLPGEPRLFLDLKIDASSVRPFARALESTVRKADALHRVLLGTRKPELVWALRDLDPALPTLFGVPKPEGIVELQSLPVVATAAPLELVPELLPQIPPQVAIWVYTINDTNDLKAVRELGVHGVITDRVAAVRRTLRPQAELVVDAEAMRLQ